MIVIYSIDRYNRKIKADFLWESAIFIWFS